MEQCTYSIESEEVKMIKKLILESVKGNEQAVVKTENMESFILENYNVKI